MGLGVTADPKGSNHDGTNENTLDHNNYLLSVFLLVLYVPVWSKVKSM